MTCIPIERNDIRKLLKRQVVQNDFSFSLWPISQQTPSPVRARQYQQRWWPGQSNLPRGIGNECEDKARRCGNFNTAAAVLLGRGWLGWLACRCDVSLECLTFTRSPSCSVIVSCLMIGFRFFSIILNFFLFVFVLLLFLWSSHFWFGFYTRYVCFQSQPQSQSKPILMPAIPYFIIW